MKILGVFLVILGIIVGLYVGIWVCFLGGIVDILNEIKSPAPIHTMTIAWAIVKIFIADTAGALVGFFIAYFGMILIFEWD